MRERIRRAIDWATATADRFTAWGMRLLAGNGIRVAWLVVGCLAAVPLLGFGVIQAASTVAHEERTEVTTIDLATTDVTGLVVDNGAGSVTVVGVDDGDAIVVRANISDGLRDTGHRVTTRDDHVFVRGTCPLFGSEWCSVDYTVEVPTDLYVNVKAGRPGGMGGRKRAVAVPGQRTRLWRPQNSPELRPTGTTGTPSAW